MVPSDATSPTHCGLSGHFSEEDIEELLGAMNGSHVVEAGNGTGLTTATTTTTTTNEAAATSSCAAAIVTTQQQRQQQNYQCNQDHADIQQQQNNEMSTQEQQEQHPNGQQAAEMNGSEISASDGDAAKAQAQARSERKRSREKQRRSDVNKQFSDLTQLLRRIDNEEKEEAERDENLTSKSFLASFNPSNRVDLVARTVGLLERLHDSNKRRKVEVKKLTKELEEAKKAGEETAARLKEAMLAPPAPANNKVMMMVPMMMSSDGSMTPAHSPMMMPHMMHQPVYTHMPSTAAPATAASPSSTAQMHPAPSSVPTAATAPVPPAAMASTSATTTSAPQAAAVPYANQNHQHPQQIHTHMQPMMMPAATMGAGAPHPNYAYPYPMAHNPYAHAVPMTSTVGHAQYAAPTTAVPATVSATPHTLHMQGNPVPSPSGDGRQSESKSDPSADSSMNAGGNLAHCA